MTVRDINNQVSAANTLLPAVRTATAAGTGVDLAGYRSAMFVAHVGTLADGTHTLDPEESDDNSTWSNIAAADLSGSFTVASSSADDTVEVVGYLGTKRYVRCNVTVAGASTGGPIGVSVVRGDPISI